MEFSQFRVSHKHNFLEPALLADVQYNSHAINLALSNLRLSGFSHIHRIPRSSPRNPGTRPSFRKESHLSGHSTFLPCRALSYLTFCRYQFASSGCFISVGPHSMCSFASGFFHSLSFAFRVSVSQGTSQSPAGPIIVSQP